MGKTRLRFLKKRYHSISLAMNLKSQISLRFSLIAMLAVFVFCTEVSVAALQDLDENKPASALPIDLDTVQTQLALLDSPSFKEREAATERLIEFGPGILDSLADHFFESSSEAGWRIHRVLEGVGKSGTEDDFLKSVAMIQILYGAQDPQSQRRLAKLQYQWKVTRRKESARKLERLGFEFTADSSNSTTAGAMERMRIEAMVRAAAIREIEGGIRIATGPEPEIQAEKNAASPPPQWVNPRENKQASLEKIKTIISGGDATNREVVAGLLPDSLQVALPPGQLVVPEDWKANEDSLELIRDLSTLSKLVIRNQEIGGSLQQFISQQKSLAGLELVDCDFDKNSNRLSLPASIKTMRFVGSLPPVSSFATLGQIDQLQLSKIDLDNELATAISKCKIQVIDLDEVKFTRDSIRRLVNMRGLFRVSLSLCQFELEWLHDIREKNRNLIVASPQAFLGVQGPVDIQSRDLTGCQISQVVPETAASKAGMQALDVVTAMDGTKIERFEDLRLLISQKRPGDTMDLEVSRLEKKIKLKVTLGEARQLSR